MRLCPFPREARMSTAKIPMWNWRDAIRKAPISTGAKCLCYSIANYLNDAGGYAFPSVETLQKDMQCGNKSIARWVKEAVDASLLRIQRMHNDRGWVYGTHYHPAFPEYAELPKSDKAGEENLDVTATCRDTQPLENGQKSSLDVNSTLRTEGLDVIQAGLDVTRTRHNSPNNCPKEKEATPATPSGIFFSTGKNQDEIRVGENVSSSFDAFLSEYKGGVARAGAHHAVPAGGEASAKAIWVKLTPEQQAEARAAMQKYFGVIRAEPWRMPKTISSFMVTGRRDFAPSEADKAQEIVAIEAQQIKCVALDINRNQHERAKTWWPTPQDIPAEIYQKGLEYAVQNYNYERKSA